VDAWEVDGIVMVDITRGTKDDAKFLRTVTDISDKAFVPITIGGVHNLEDVARYFDHGADKVLINSAAIETPSLIEEISRKYGTNAVTVGIDVKETTDGYRVYSQQGTRPCGLLPCDWARQVEEAGAGEILLTSINRDGSLQGYDLVLTKSVVNACNIPVVPLGGAGAWPHFVDACAVGAHGVATQNIYHFTSASIISAKKTMQKSGITVRLEKNHEES
jgi:cyclase